MMEDVSIDPKERINELFARPEGDVLGRCLVEREHPEAVDALRTHLTHHCERFTPTVFDHHNSWGFARATTGWLFQHDPVAYVEAVRMALDLMANYPKVDVVVEGLGDIMFRTDSYYSDTPILRDRYAREVAFTEVLLNEFPQADYEALTAWMKNHRELVETTNPSSFEITPGFVFEGYYGLLVADPDALDAWAKAQGVRAWMTLSLPCNKDPAMAVKKALEASGFAVLMTSPYRGTYELNITLEKNA